MTLPAVVSIINHQKGFVLAPPVIGWFVAVLMFKSHIFNPLSLCTAV